MNEKILFVFSGQYPWDIRLSKEINTLKKCGYKISVLSRNLTRLNAFDKIDEVVNYRLGNIFPSLRMDVILSIPIFFNPLWIFKIAKTIWVDKPDLIIIREIPLAPTVIFFAKIFKIKVILDVAEHFPALMKVSKKYNSNIFSKFMISTLNFYDFIEKISVKNSDKILTVVEESKNRLIKEYGLKEKNLYVVSNTPETIPPFYVKKIVNDKLNIIYTGNVDGVFRGLKTLLLAATLLKENNNIVFNIIGDGSELNSLIEFKNNNGLDNVNFLGKFEHDKLLQYLYTQDIGIVPHEKTDEIEYTIPNKLFDYMSYSLPVITSSAKPLKRITESIDCGFVFEAGNPESLADLILKIYENRQSLITKAKNAHSAIIEKYKWDNDSKVFCGVVEEIL